ncbi:MAG: amidohydrolase family protein, partial [Acidobacteriota bacterium]|nr:amidohydrolase family protein [Acidobacteriota bacterium]
VVTPGLFDSFSNMGLAEVGQVAPSVDAAVNDERWTAAFDIADAINPRSVLIPVNRIAGLTRTIVAPNTGKSLIAGEGAVIHLGGDRDYLVRTRVATFASLGEAGARLAGGSRAAALLRLREALSDSLDYAAHRAEYDRSQRRSYSLSRLDLEALLPVARGERPLVVTVDRASDIEAVLRLGREMRLRLILAQADEGWMVAKQIAAAHVPVLVKGLDDLPQSFEQLGATLENAARLYRAGVTIAFMSADAHNARNIRQQAGNAVANGLPWDAALAALTSNPARIWGLSDRLGSLEAGKEADVVVWDGDPLEVTSYPTHVFIRGSEMPLRSRQTELRDRYLKRVPPGPAAKQP